MHVVGHLADAAAVVEARVEGVEEQGDDNFGLLRRGEGGDAGAAFCVRVVVVGVYEEKGFSWDEGEGLEGEVVVVWEA